jgi:sugar O-acyltransferase (sialic acid O-acetyltransferase NeuD family)
MNDRRVILVGGGGHALVVADAARLAGLTLAGVFDDNPRCRLVTLLGLHHHGTLADLAARSAPLHPAPLHLALGDNDLRARTSHSLDHAPDRAPDRKLATIIHPRAIVADSASLAPGVFVGPGAIVNALARIAQGAILNSGAIVEHDCAVGPFAHIAPGAALGGEVSIGERTLIGLGARVLPGVKIGARCVVGAGAVVTRDLPDGSTVRGIPAR